jgi:hypothetical protein
MLPRVALGSKVFADVMDGLMVCDVHEPCWAFQLCSSSWAERSVALAKWWWESAATIP